MFCQHPSFSNSWKFCQLMPVAVWKVVKDDADPVAQPPYSAEDEKSNLGNIYQKYGFLGTIKLQAGDQQQLKGIKNEAHRKLRCSSEDVGPISNCQVEPICS